MNRKNGQKSYGMSLCGQKRLGMSLFELLIVITIFVIVAGIAGQIIFTTFRGSSKSEVTVNVKQNANNAFSVMERALHSSLGISSCTSQRVNYFDGEGVLSSFSCENVGSSGYIASGSARLTDESVTVTSCTISCTSESGVTSAVIFDITFQQATPSAGRPEEESTLQVRTRVLLRN